MMGRSKHLITRYLQIGRSSRRKTTRHRMERDLAMLSPLLECVAPLAPPVGLLAKIEAQIECVEPDRSVTPGDQSQGWFDFRMLCVGIFSAAIGAGIAVLAMLAMFSGG